MPVNEHWAVIVNVYVPARFGRAPSINIWMFSAPGSTDAGPPISKRTIDGVGVGGVGGGLGCVGWLVLLPHDATVTTRPTLT